MSTNQAYQNVTTEVVQVTPDYAEALLRRNPNNRDIKAARVAEWSSIIRNGKWELNGETIVIGESGNLLDGQHRLAAVVATGFTVPMLLVSGIKDESSDTIDTGVGRSASDIAGMRGLKYATTQAPSATFVYRVISGADWTIPVPASYTLETARRYPSIEEGCAFYIQNPTLRALLPCSVYATIYTYLKEIAQRADLAETFAQQMATGNGIQPGSPIGAFRNRIMALRGSQKGRIGSRILWTGAVRMIDALEDGRTIERIQMSNNAINGFVPDRLKRHLQRLPVPKQLRDIPAPVREGATKRLIKRLKPEQFDRQVKRTSAMRAGLKTQKAA